MLLLFFCAGHGVFRSEIQYWQLGALRILLAAAHEQRRATRLVTISTGNDLRCESSWQRHTNTSKQRGLRHEQQSNEATRRAAQTAGSGRHEQPRATSNRTGALRIQLAAPHKQRRATRLVRNSTRDDLRCEYSWQRRKSNAAYATSTIDSEDRCESKQATIARDLNHTRRVSWQVAQAQTNPESRLIFAAKNRQI